MAPRTEDRPPSSTTAPPLGVRWAIVLAAGSGSRLRSLTTDAHGGVVPKQYCTLLGDGTLLERAIARAERLVARERIVVVVAAEHERFWSRCGARLPRENLVVQPRNRGTAVGLLLGLTTVVRRDPEGVVCALPADQFARREDVLVEVAARALGAAARGDVDSVLLGVAPDEPVTDYGWILPGRMRGGLQTVDAFVEKPAPALAASLFARGALWNSFLFAARAATLITMVECTARGRHLLSRIQEALLLGHDALARLYDVLPDIDLSRDVFQRHPAERLRVLAVPRCGWTDLGTPERVASCLAQAGPAELAAAMAHADGSAPNLARRVQEHVVAHSA